MCSVTICACGTDFLARSTSVIWTTAMSQSAGIVSTDVLITVRSGRCALIRFRNFVAPIAEEPIPASQANTTFLTPSVLTATGSAPAPVFVPFASAFLLATSSCASSKLLPLDMRMTTDAIPNETAVAISTPTITETMLSLDAIIRYAMIEPGDAGPTSPAFVRLYQKIAAILPAIGAMITSGFISMYGK